MSESQLRVLVLLPFFLFLSGCASKGFNRGELKEQLGSLKPVFDDKEIEKTFAKKPNLPKPFTLAIYFASPQRQRNIDGQWRWTEEDKNQLEELAKELKTEGLVSNIFPIIDSLVKEEDIKSLRLVAAKHQADALMVVSGAGEMDRYINGWGWTYALLVPTLFVPGSIVDTLFVTNASIWDVKNEYLYLTAEAEATTHETYVAAFGKNDRDLINESKRQSLKALSQELRKMIKGTKF